MPSRSPCARCGRSSRLGRGGVIVVAAAARSHHSRRRRLWFRYRLRRRLPRPRRGQQQRLPMCREKEDS